MIETASVVDVPAELIKRFWDDCAVRGLSVETARRYISSINIFNQFLQEHGFEILDVDKEVLRTFLEYPRKRPQYYQKDGGELFCGFIEFL